MQLNGEVTHAASLANPHLKITSEGHVSVQGFEFGQTALSHKSAIAINGPAVTVEAKTQDVHIKAGTGLTAAVRVTSGGRALLLCSLPMVCFVHLPLPPALFLSIPVKWFPEPVQPHSDRHS